MPLHENHITTLSHGETIMLNEYDIVIIGSGLAGSATAMVLSRVGFKVLVIEKKAHPRFVIGESTVITTTLLFNLLAQKYDVPELGQLAHYLTLRENGCAAWPKQHLWWGLHRENQPLDPAQESLFETHFLPSGPDVHMLRADADAFLVSRLDRYGVDYEDWTDLLNFETDATGVNLQLSGPRGERVVRARYIVDASGHASFFASRFGLRDKVPNLGTNTRSIFGHFEGVPNLDDVLSGNNPSFRFRRQGGTMHHCFPGGWIWVIPFDNGVTSVGLQLDCRMYPLDERISPEAELKSVVMRYPSIEAHLGEMKPVRDLLRTGRIQFSSKTILGDRFILTPHAAGFVEPLYSTGLVLTLTFIARFAEAAREAKEKDDFSQEQFRSIERWFFQELRQIDRIVDGSIQSFRNFDVFKQFWRSFLIGTMAQFGLCLTTKADIRHHPMIYGTAIPGFTEVVEEMHAMVCRPPSDEEALALALKDKIDPWYEQVCAPVLYLEPGKSDWSTRSRMGCGVCTETSGFPVHTWTEKIASQYAALGAHVGFENSALYLLTFPKRFAEMLGRYRESRSEGSDYHRAFERILDMENPSAFNYRSHLENLENHFKMLFGPSGYPMIGEQATVTKATPQRSSDGPEIVSSAGSNQ
jgi:tetracycline 7-halogenase / FADH2 O2-dependent halogenase